MIQGGFHAVTCFRSGQYEQRGYNLYEAIADRNESRVNRLLTLRQDINVILSNDGGKTLLHKAILEGEVRIVRALLEHSEIDPNQVDGDGFPVLITAVTRSTPEVVAELLTHPGLNPNLRDEQDALTALHQAIILQSEPMIQRLLADPRVDRGILADENSEDPLTLRQFARLYGCPEALINMLPNSNNHGQYDSDMSFSHLNDPSASASHITSARTSDIDETSEAG